MNPIEAEVLVVGGGIAGCAAAFTSARRHRTVLVSAGGSATSLSSGCVDFHAGAGREKTGPFLEALEKAGLALDEGGQVITNAGLERNVDIRQQTMLAIDEAKAEGVSVLDIPWLRASHARMAVHGLRTIGVAAEVVSPGADTRKLLDHCAAAEIGERLACSVPKSGRGLVALPALWDRTDAAKILEAAGNASGLTFRELVGPAGPQGLRLQKAAEAAARPATVMMGAELISLEFEHDACVGAVIRSGLRELRLRCSAVIMATGGPLISRPGVEPGLDRKMGSLPSMGVQAPFLASDQGMAVRQGRRVRNVAICGSALTEMGYLEGRGMGDCILSGISASELLEERR
jgi:anaerobic glycerol-3-phosphate dehydrogenase